MPQRYRTTRRSSLPRAAEPKPSPKNSAPLRLCARSQCPQSHRPHRTLPWESWRKASRYKKKVHRHLPGKYHSAPNVAANLLGRVDLRVDRQCFRNHMKIQDYLWAVIHVSHSRIGTGRHGGHPSQKPRSEYRSERVDLAIRGTESWRKASRYKSLSATNTVASGFIPRFVVLSPGVKPSPKKLCASAPLREITVPAKPPSTQDCPENPGVKPVATKKGSSSFTREIPLCAYCGGDSVGEGRPPCRPPAV